MDPLSAKALAAAKTAASWLWKRIRPFRAEKSAGEQPEQLKTADQARFDNVLDRIATADPTDSIFQRSIGAIANKLFTPEHLRSLSVQNWLREPSVRRDLQRAASPVLIGMPSPPDTVQRLETRFQEIASASSQESSPVVSSVIAMLVAGVQARVQDAGTAAMVASGFKETSLGIAEIHAKLDRIVPDEAQEQPGLSALTPLDPEIATVWRAAFGAASRDLLKWPATLVGGEHIVRPELEQLLAMIRSKQKGAVALLGLPGSGKSAMLARFGQVLAEAEPSMAVLAIKGDLLDANVASESDLQRDLQLPELPSVMLRRLAITGPVALLIDQLDALAGHLDTRTGRLSVLLNLVKAMSNVDGVHVCVSCRKFEFMHDIRLSRIEAESVTLELPSWPQVLQVLEAQNVKAGSWNSDAQEVMRVPQHLNTYLQLKASGSDEPVANYTAMLDRLWRIRVLQAPGGSQAADLACEIAETMADKETLWLASAHFDNRTQQITLLESAGILTRSQQGGIGFSHQTVFEHVLARNFAKSQSRLSAYILARTDSLFVRPKLWAALGYLRGVEPVTYEAELDAIWSAQQLRKHLRFLLIDFLGSQPKPSDKEVLLLTAAAEQPELRHLILKAIIGSEGWFKRFESNLIPAAMSDRKTADVCVDLLVDAWAHSEARVEELLREVWVSGRDDDRRILFVLRETPAWTPSLVAIAKTVASRVEVSPFHIDHFFAVVGNTEPKIAIELLRVFLDAELARQMIEAQRLRTVLNTDSPKEGEPEIAWRIKHDATRPIADLLDATQHWASAPALAAASPSQFIETLWPWYVHAFEQLLDFSGGGTPYFGYSLPYSADFRFKGENQSKLLPSPLLEAVTIAVELLSKDSPHSLLRWAGEQGHIEMAPVQRLVAHALAHNPAETAKSALQFLMEDERRYFLGYLSYYSSTTLALVTVCSAHWSAAEVASFATKVRGYSPPRPAEKRSVQDIRWWHRFVGRTRANLLRAIEVQVRSPDIRREVEEGNRAFPQSTFPESFVGGWIGPPMDAGQLSRASNDDILTAFKFIPDKSGWDHPKHFARGGNVQLAQAFAEFAIAHPGRALEIIKSLQPDFGQRAAGYAIQALAETHGPEELMDLAVALHARGFDAEEFITSIAQAVGRLLERQVTISEELLGMLEGWVSRTKAASLSGSSGNQAESSSGNENSFLLSGHQGFDFVSGSDYLVIAAVVNARLARNEVHAVIRLLRLYLRDSQDENTWEGLTHHMAEIPALAPEDGRSLISEVLFLPQLDGSRGAALLMASTRSTALDAVMPHLRRWRDSKNVAARKGYGELVALIALTDPKAGQARQWLDELVESEASRDARAGATATAVQILWGERQFRAEATDLILRLLGRNEAPVWKEVFGLFRIVDKLEPEPHTVRLLRGIADDIGYAPPPEESYVVERLGTLLPHHADLVARIATHLIQLWRDQLASMGSALVTAGPEMIDLAVTLHRTEGTRMEGLQMFEQLIEIDAYQARETLDEIDSRLRPRSTPSRPRLPRRSRHRKNQSSS